MQMDNTILLNDGSLIPQLGFGTFGIVGDMAETVVKQALRAGFRHFDTATRYENEASIGRGLKHSGLFRQELYIVSKIWPSSYDAPEKAIEYSLRQLDMDYIDSYYLHWPTSDESRRNRAWQALLRYREKGLLGSVGVSNFTQEQLERLIDTFGVVPVVNQIELHPWYPQRQLSAWCRKNSIAPTAWGPAFRGHIGEVSLMGELGERYRKSPVQIVLRWHLQHGNIIIPKTSSPERMAENTQLFDFVLTLEDMARIDALECKRHFGGDPNTNNGENFTVRYD